MMLDAIKNFATQFSFEPVVENAAKLIKTDKFTIAGMGGSALPGALIKMWHPAADIIIHRDYGVPLLDAERLRNRLFIAVSYSGNTEETLDAFETAFRANYTVAAVATAGKLIEAAQHYGAPYVQLPDLNVQPRMALGAQVKAMAKLMDLDQAFKDLAILATTLQPAGFEAAGKALAGQLVGKVPVVYASSANSVIAYNWKIKLNETAKIPAFCNVLPELNHNEMTGFDVKDSTRPLSSAMAFVMLRDPADHPRVQRRFEVLTDLYKARGLTVRSLELAGGNNHYFKTFASLLTADWTALHLAQQYGVEPEQVPMVEEFKKLI